MDFLSKNNINMLILESKTFNESVLNVIVNYCTMKFYKSLC